MLYPKMLPNAILSGYFDTEGLLNVRPSVQSLRVPIDTSELVSGYTSGPG